MERIEQRASFGGWQEVWKHSSSSLQCEMKLAVYLPPAALKGEKCPVLYWLSGLTCTEQNFITKAGAQQYAAQHGFIVVAPDTSPRGEGIANDPAYDLGQGAGFYLNATQAPGRRTSEWKTMWCRSCLRWSRNTFLLRKREQYPATAWAATAL